MTTERIVYGPVVGQYSLTVVAATGTEHQIRVTPVEVERLRRALAAPTSPPAAVPAPVQGADPTGPQEAHSGDEEPISDADLRKMWQVYERAAAAAEDSYLGRSDAGLQAAIMLATGPLRYQVNRWVRALSEEQAAHQAERERADKAEAERDAHATARNLAAEEYRKLEAERDAARRWATEADAIATDILRIVEKVSDWDASEYHARLAELRAGTEEAQTAGLDDYDRGFTDGAAHERGRHRLFGCPNEAADAAEEAQS